MDFVYVCREGDNEELRYSIRSTLANYATVGKVWVVGGKPNWYSGNFIPVKDTSNKFANIKNCIKVACESDDISEDFVLMNDDFFITQKLNSVSLYHGGLLFKRYQTHSGLAGPNMYATLLLRTHEALRKKGVVEPLNYDLHTPMIINKTNMLSIVDEPYSIRSYYGNIFNIGGDQIDDVKIYSNMVFSSTSSSTDNGSPYFSTEDGSFKSVKNYLSNLFPEPSIYEYPYSESN